MRAEKDLCRLGLERSEPQPRIAIEPEQQPHDAMAQPALAIEEQGGTGGGLGRRVYGRSLTMRAAGVKAKFACEAKTACSVTRCISSGCCC